ncbi:MAG: hypothetical protein HOP10_04405 [Chitinophagaceae bacterium]|nr:hypothetical protein [Chitinophagaceae bacterium]
MKKLFFFLPTVIICQTITAQNVGIGTTTPSSRLHLVGNLLQENGTVTLNSSASIIQFQNTGINKTFMQLSGDNLRLGTNGGNQLGKTIIRMAGQDRVLIDSTGNTQILGLQDASLTSDGYITLGSTTGRNMILDNNEIMVRSNGGTDNLILQNDGGNVGIGLGTGAPTAKLHVNGDVRITDGNQASGRVLTSDASGNASWQNAAFSNNDRIFIRYSSYGQFPNNDSLINGTTTLYDNGSINFNFITTDFTVTKSGLYHFEGTMSGTNDAVEEGHRLLIFLEPYIFINNTTLIPLTSFSEYYDNIDNVTLDGIRKFVHPFNIDLYLNAGSTVKFKFFGRSISAQNPGYISAYLISE